MEHLTERFKEARENYLAGDYQKAAAINQVTIQRARASENQEAVVCATRYLGLCEYRLGQVKRSEATFKVALTAAEEGGFQNEAVLVHNHLGNTVRALGRMEDALEAFEDGMKLAEECNFAMGKCRLEGSIGALYDSIGHSDQAKSWYGRYLQSAKDLEDSNRICNGLNLLGRLSLIDGDRAEARRIYTSAMHHAEVSGATERLVTTIMHLADVDAADGDTNRAGDGYDEALKLATEAGNPLRQADLHLKLADLCSRRRDYQSSIEHFRRCIKLSEDHEIPQRHASGQMRLGRLYREIGMRGHGVSAFAGALSSFNLLLGGLRQNEMRESYRRTFSELTPMLQDMEDDLINDRWRTEEIAMLRASFLQFAEDPTWDPELDQDSFVIGRLREEQRWLEAESRAADSSQREEDLRAILNDMSRARDSEYGLRWRELYLPGFFEKLGSGSQEALIQAEIHLEMVQISLGRCIELFGKVIEHELNSRIFLPFQRHWRTLNKTYPRPGRFDRADPLRFARQNSRMVVEGLQRSGKQSLGKALNITNSISEIWKRDEENHRDDLEVYIDLIDWLGEKNRLHIAGVSKFRNCRFSGKLFYELRNALVHDEDRPQLSRLMIEEIRASLTIKIPHLLRAIVSIEVGDDL